MEAFGQIVKGPTIGKLGQVRRLLCKYCIFMQNLISGVYTFTELCSMYEEMIRFLLSLHYGGIKISSLCVSMNKINGIMNHVVEVGYEEE